MNFMNGEKRPKGIGAHNTSFYVLKPYIQPKMKVYVSEITDIICASGCTSTHKCTGGDGCGADGSSANNYEDLD